jgi:hypothetical protein
MKKEEILEHLQNEVKSLATFTQSMSDSAFFQRPSPEKWSAAETLQHLVLSVRPLVFAFALPRILLRLFFGKPNRATRTYEALVEKYQAKLMAGGKAPRAFVPQVKKYKPAEVVAAFITNYQRFSYRAGRVPEADLDRYLIAHPLLGKLTLREMLYFTRYHVQHHFIRLKATRN